MPVREMVAPARLRRSLDDTDALQGLTTKQLLFASLSFSGLSDVDAYRQSYGGVGMTEGSIGVAAHRLAHDAKVQAKLLELRLARDRQSSLIPMLNREFVLNGVMGLALNSDKDSVRLAAYQTLGKTVGIDLFRETTVIEKRTRTVEDVDRELRERLAALAPMIEGTVRSPEPDPPPDRRRKPRT